MVTLRKASSRHAKVRFRPCLDTLEHRTLMSGFTDNFEGPTLNSYWTTSVQSGSITFPSTAMAHSGSQSVQLNSTNSAQDKGIQIRHDFATPTYGTASIWFFDTGAGATSSNYISMFSYYNNLAADAQLVTYDYGFAGGGPGRGDQYNVQDGPYLKETGITRTASWHQYKIASTPDSFSLFVDGVQVRTRSGGTPFDEVGFSMSGPSWRPAWTSYFDDFEFIPYGQPDLVATSLAWNTAQGGADYAYAVSGNDLPKGATGALYWSTDSSFNLGQHKKIDGTGFTTATKAQTDPYTGHVTAATLGTPPDPSYKYLLFVLNSDDAVTESDGPFASDKNDVRAIPLQPDLVMQKAVERSVMTLAVDYVINNAAVSQPLQFDIYRSASAPTSGARYTPGPDDINVSSVVLPASDTPDLSIGSHTGVVLSLSSNLAPDPTRPFVIVVANPAGSNHFTESDESLGSDPNNAASFQLPDIRLDDVTTRDASNAVIFQDFQVAYSIANSVSPAFVLRAYLAPGPSFDAAQDQVLGQSGVSAPGMRLPNDDGSARSYTTVIHLNQPADVSARHYIIIVADPDAAIAETSKANNDLFAIPVLENTHAINRIGEEGSTSAVPEASTDASGRFIAPILRGTDEFSQLRSLDSVWSPSPLFGFDLYQDPSTLKGQEERLAQPSLLPPTQYLAALLVADQERAPALWANVTFSINAAYDSTGGHHPGSLHYEGRALDIQDLGGDPNNRPERLGRIAGLAWLAGFDWSYVEPNDEKPPLTDAGAANHVHVSARASIVPNILAPIGDQSVVQGLPLILQANMSDPALALDQLVFSLQLGGAPSGATIDPSSGQFDWTPTVRPGLYTVTIRVDDLSIPGLYSTRTFSVTVNRWTSPSNFGHEVFVTTLYNEVLGREPEPEGLAFWSKQLALKAKPRTVAISIWNSRERHILQGQHKAPPIRFNRALGDATKAWKQAIRL